MLTCSDLTVAYGDIVALHGVSLTVGAGETVALIGANGAGKTTLLQTISGLNRPRSGDILFEGSSLAGVSCERRVRRGLAHAPEGRRIFPGLTVEENLIVATAPWRRTGGRCTAELSLVFDLFPRLKERRRQLGWSLSGGEQQMLAIGRALVTGPKLLLLDEPTEGLAPVIVDALVGSLRELKASGLSILLVEQSLAVCTAVADRLAILDGGVIVWTGDRDELWAAETVRARHLSLEHA